MPRTYATKTGGRGGCGSSKPFQDHRDPKPLFKETVSKRAAPGLWDDSLDSSHEATSSLFRPVLKPVDDNIIFNNSSSYNNSIDSTSGRVAFKSRNAKEDTFDALFADVKLKPLVRRPKLVLSPGGYGGDPFSSGASSAETSLNVGAAAPGLFDSFDRVDVVKEKEKPKARAKPKTKSSARLKSTKLSVQQEPVTPKLSETLQVHNYVKFEHQVPMYMESPLLSRGLQATSTPSIGAGSHRDLGSHQDTLDVSGINGIVMDDDVFKEADEGVHVVPESSLCENGQDLSSAAGVELHGGGSKNSLSTDQTPLRSACSVSRGSNKSGGPVKSLFLAGGEEFSSSRVNTSRAGENELNSDDPDFSQDITVDVQCICGSNLVTESQLIQCVHCLHYLHTDCVNLGDTAIAEVEQGLDWFCPACRNLTCSDGTSLFMPTPVRTAEQNKSPKKTLVTAEESYTGESDANKENEDEKQETSMSHGAKLISGYEAPQLLDPHMEASMFDLQHQSVASCPSSPHSSSCVAASPTPSSASALADLTPSPGKSVSAQLNSMVSSPSSSQSNMQSSTKEQQDSGMSSQEKMQPASTEPLDCTADVLAFALNQDDMSPLPFTSGHQGFASNREYSTVSNDESRMAFSPKPSHNLASSASKEQLDCTADVLALASKLGEMSPLPFLKPRTTLFRKPKAQVTPQSPSLSAKPGKNWRRSLAAAKRDTLTSNNTSFATSRLSMVPSKMTRDTLAMTNTSFATSRLSMVRLSEPLKTRSSFYMVPTKASTASRSPKAQDKVSKLLEGLLEDEGGTEEETGEVEEAECLASLSLAEAGLKSKDEELLAVCSGGKVVKFEEIYTEEVMKGAVKVGECAFGEVFRVGVKEGASVLKIIPFGGDIDINQEKQTTVEDIISEVTISMALSTLRESSRNCTSGFVEVRGAHVFRGDYPCQLLGLWDKFAEEKGTENERPDKLGQDQTYIALEFNNAGSDLEKFVFKNATQAFAVWKQVAHTLAVAEQSIEFEHRDLHWGNVLVKEVKGTKVCEFKLDGDNFKVEAEDTLATIIDFSLSRAEVEGKLIFNNLAEDPAVFQGRGADQGGDYQFDIYRSMKQHNQDCWDKFRPRSNVLWLHYLLTKMTIAGEVHYSNKTKKTSKLHKSGLSRMNALKKRLLEFSSAAEWVKREGERVDDM